jgi:hypothetical protein
MTDQPEQPFTSQSSEMSDEDEARAARLQNRFDIRRIIGGLFVIYGVVLTLMGIFGSSHVKNKADGVNINLWTGLALLLFAAFMIGWALLRPVQPDPPDTRGQGSGRIRRAPAT